MTYQLDVAGGRDIVARWCALAEQRLHYLTELFETGRWRRFHTELSFLENIQEAKAAVDATDASSNSTKPETPRPGHMAEKEKQATDKPGLQNPGKSTVPTTATNPSVPEPPRESPDDKAAIEAALKAARKALADRDLAEVEIQLAQATLIAVSPEMLAKVGQLKLLAEYVSQFWDAVHQMLPKL